MDANKLKKLRELDYEIRTRFCSTCKHGNFLVKGGPYGACKLHTYEHLKHTDSVRQLSVHRFGCCKDFEAATNLNLVTSIDYTWEEFIK